MAIADFFGEEKLLLQCNSYSTATRPKAGQAQNSSLFSNLAWALRLIGANTHLRCTRIQQRKFSHRRGSQRQATLLKSR
jgi:hypothetical protein